MKRLFDIISSGLVMLAFLPIGIVLAIILRFSGEGEIFYRQKRVGRNAKTFEVLKFATMLSAQAFDSRMIWDRIEEADDAARPATSSSTRPAQ